jgi:ATP-binding cassette subfamily B protein
VFNTLSGTITSKFKPFEFLRRLIVIVWRAAPRRTAIKASLIIAQGLLPILSIYLTKLLVDEITANTQLAAPQFSGVLWLISLLAAVTLIGALCMSLAEFVDDALEQAVTNHMLSLLYSKSVALDLAHYENSAYHDTLHRAQREAMYRPVQILNSLGRVAQEGLTLVALTALLLTLNWVIALILFLSTLPSAVVRLIYSQRFYALSRENTPKERESWYFHILLTNENYAKEVRLFDLGPMFMKRTLDLRHVLYRARMALLTRRTIMELIAASPGGLAVLGATIYIAHQTVLGAITLGILVMYYQAFQRGQSNLRSISQGLVHLYESSLFLENLFEFLDLQPRILELPQARPVPRPIQSGIVFHDVHFAYGDRPVLKGVTLTIRPGEHIALVGANGAGKTTLVKLLSRLHDPSAGRITIDGVNLRELKLAELRREIGVIFQDHVRYNLTARENIWIGNATRDPGDERIALAVHAAAANTLIDKLRDGYETRLGNWFEKGQDLSGGEWQKIALARAFFRDAQILVLDEPTSALDATAEYEVFQKFHELAEGRTTILISHRFSTVRMAHRIYVLEDGRILEAGSHAELMALGAEYARMYELQARNYR